MTSDMMTASEVRAALNLREPKVLHIAVSTKPWGDYKESDYSIQQWHVACLIHQHDGPPTSKAQCKLPVKTPDGTLNANGVHAAAAALAGARGGVSASADQKATAARALVRYYRQLNDDPPPSLMQSAITKVEGFIAHFGIRGMKWGVRRSRGPGGTVGSAIARKQAGEPDDVAAIKTKAATSGIHSLSNNEMQTLVNRMNLQQNITKLNAQPGKVERGREFANRQLKTGDTLNKMITFANSPAGHLIASAIRSSGTGRHAGGAHAAVGATAGTAAGLRTLVKTIKR